MIGILPCAGEAKRIHGLPKFLLPIPGGYLLDWHIGGMLAAGCTGVLIGASDENAPILRQYTLHNRAEVEVARHHATMSETVQSLYSKASYEYIALFGMPDTYWTAPDVYERMTTRIMGGAQVAVAVFPLRLGQHRSIGCVELDGERVTNVIDKPEASHYTYGWGALAWTQPFWDLISPDDPHIGYAVARAVKGGRDVRAVMCDGDYYDCGTLDGYFECVRSFEAVTHGA